MTLLIILSFLGVLIIGFIALSIRFNRYYVRFKFAHEYREKFVKFSNKYSEENNRWDANKKFDAEIYMWLTKNVYRIQDDLGRLGSLHYVAPFQMYQISNYQIVVNTIPKFRTGEIEDFDINSTDDCLLRYLGMIESILEKTKKRLKNPVIWFQEGFQLIVSVPLYILNWFGIIGDSTVNKVTTNNLFKIFSGIGGLVAFFSGLVTIIQGKESVVEFLNSILHK